MSTFTDAFAEFLDAFVAVEPVAATAIGDHRHDGRWPDLTADGRRARLVFIDTWSDRFAAIADAELERDDAIDRDLVLGELAAWRFDETELREDAWNPLAWIYLLGEGLFPLLARDFAPLAVRLASVAARLKTMTSVTDAARETLVGAGPGRPVGRFQTESGRWRRAKSRSSSLSS